MAQTATQNLRTTASDTQLDVELQNIFKFFKGTIRLILRDHAVEVHHTVSATSRKLCGTGELGIDKGYSEAFVDSDGGSSRSGVG